MIVCVLVVVAAAVFRVALRQIVVVEVEKALDEEHRQETAEQPVHGFVERMQLLLGVRQKMEQRDAEHEAGDKADGDLQPRVRQVNGEQEPAARERSEQH